MLSLVNPRVKIPNKPPGSIACDHKSWLELVLMATHTFVAATAIWEANTLFVGIENPMKPMVIPACSKWEDYLIWGQKYLQYNAVADIPMKRSCSLSVP